MTTTWPVAVVIMNWTCNLYYYKGNSFANTYTQTFWVMWVKSVQAHIKRRKLVMGNRLFFQYILRFFSRDVSVNSFVARFLLLTWAILTCSFVRPPHWSEVIQLWSICYRSLIWNELLIANHVLITCGMYQQSRNKYHTEKSLKEFIDEQDCWNNIITENTNTL